MSDALHCAYLLSLRASLCALVILSPIYHLHTSYVIMISFAGGELNEIPLRASLLSSSPLQGIVAHTSSQELRFLRFTVAACRTQVKPFFGRMLFSQVFYS